MHRLFHLTLLFTILSLSLASASSTHDVVAADLARVRHRMIKKRQGSKTDTASGSGVLGSGGLGVVNAVPNPNEETAAGGATTGAGTATSGGAASTAAASATGAGAGSDKATSGAGTEATGTPVAGGAGATNTPATSQGAGGGIVGSIVSGLLGGGNTATPNATDTKTTATSTSSTSTTSTSTTPNATPTTPTSTAKDTEASQTPASTSVDSNGSTVIVFATVPAQASQTAESDDSGKKGVPPVGKKTIIILVAIGASIGAVGIIWTVIRKWKFRPSSSFDERLQPIDWQPTNDDAPGAAGGQRDITEKALERNSSTRSHGSFTSGNGHGQRGSQDHLTADIPQHDFTAGAAHLAPVGGYADLQRGPSPQPYDYDYARAASPYQVPPPPQVQPAQYEQYEYTINTHDAGLPNPYAGAGAGGTGAPQMQQYYGHGGNAAAYQGYEHRGY